MNGYLFSENNLIAINTSKINYICVEFIEDHYCIIINGLQMTNSKTLSETYLKNVIHTIITTIRFEPNNIYNMNEFLIKEN